MGRKITYVILLLLMIGICVGILTGCDFMAENKKDFVMDMPPKENTALGAEQEQIKENLAEDEETKKYLIDKKELDWMTLQENLRPSILRITCGGYTGSGVVWEITKEKVTVVTSGHLLKNAEVCKVECYAGIYYEAKVEKVLEDCDIGFAVFPTEVMREDGVELKAAETWEQRRKLIQGEELAIYGSMESVAGNFVKGYLIEAEREIQIDGYEKPQILMLGGILQSGEGSGALQREQEGKAEPDVIRHPAL